MNAGGVIEVYNSDTRGVDFVGYAFGNHHVGIEFRDSLKPRMNLYRDIIDRYTTTNDMQEFHKRLRMTYGYIDKIKGWWGYFTKEVEGDAMLFIDGVHSYNIRYPLNDTKPTHNGRFTPLVIHDT
jgi:hypothetical protein